MWLRPELGMAYRIHNSLSLCNKHTLQQVFYDLKFRSATKGRTEGDAFAQHVVWL